MRAIICIYSDIISSYCSSSMIYICSSYNIYFIVMTDFIVGVMCVGKICHLNPEGSSTSCPLSRWACECIYIFICICSDVCYDSVLEIYITDVCISSYVYTMLLFYHILLTLTLIQLLLLLLELLRVVPGGWQLGHSGAGQGHAADRPR